MRNDKTTETENRPKVGEQKEEGSLQSSMSDFSRWENSPIILTVAVVTQLYASELKDLYTK